MENNQVSQNGNKKAVGVYVTGLISFISGIVALIPFPTFAFIPGLILGYISKNKYQTDHMFEMADRGYSFAKKGILFSYIGIATNIIGLILYVMLIMHLQENYSDTTNRYWP